MNPPTLNQITTTQKYPINPNLIPQGPARRRNAITNLPPMNQNLSSSPRTKQEENNDCVFTKEKFEQLQDLESAKLRAQKKLSKEVLDRIKEMTVLATEEGLNNLFTPPFTSPTASYPPSTSPALFSCSKTMPLN